MINKYIKNIIVVFLFCLSCTSNKTLNQDSANKPTKTYSRSRFEYVSWTSALSVDNFCRKLLNEKHKYLFIYQNSARNQSKNDSSFYEWLECMDETEMKFFIISNEKESYYLLTGKKLCESGRETNFRRYYVFDAKLRTDTSISTLSENLNNFCISEDGHPIIRRFDWTDAIWKEDDSLFSVETFKVINNKFKMIDSFVLRGNMGNVRMY